MIGTRIGAVIGSKIGAAIGVGADELDGGGVPPPSATKDATSNVYIPATAAESVAIGLPSFTSIYRCQEAAGSLLDSGPANVPLPASGAGQAYQQAVAGWTTLAVTLTDGTNGGWKSAAAGLPDPATTSTFLFCYVVLPTTPAAARSILELFTAQITARLTVAPVAALTIAGAVTNGTTNPTGAAAVRFLGIQYDVTNLVEAVYTDQDKIVGAFVAKTGKSACIGGTTTAVPPAMKVLYAGRIDGTAAQMNSAAVKSFITTLGNGLWAPPWS